MSTATAETEVLPAAGVKVVVDGVTYVIGDPASQAQLAAMPVGSTVFNGDDAPGEDRSWYIKIDMASGRAGDIGVWEYSRGRLSRVSYLAPNYNPIRSIPGRTPVPHLTEVGESVAEYKRRFADFVLAKVEALSEAKQTEAREALTKLGLIHPVRTGMRLSFRDTAPDGTVLQVGEPDEPEFTVFRYDSAVAGRLSRWRKVSGHYVRLSRAPSGSGVVVYTPGDPFGETPGDQEALIAEFKEWIWDQAQALKSDYTWCSALEKILAEFGIGNPGPMPDLSNWPDLIEPGRANRDPLPVGTVLAAADGDWGIFVKVGDDDKTGAGWERKAGTRPKCRGQMRLLYYGGGNPNRCVISNAGPLLEFLPDGTVVARGGATSAYTKRDGVWVRNEDGTRRDNEAMRAGTAGRALVVQRWAV